MKEQINKCVEILRDGGTILYPTDTVWGLGCDATNEKAVSKIFEIKNRAESKSLIQLVDSMAMLKTYVKQVPTNLQLVLNQASKPTTVIYNDPVGLAANAVSQDATVAIRIVQHKFCQELLKAFGKPIVSTSANISGQATPKTFKEIDPVILKLVDYVVDLPTTNKTVEPSRIIKIQRDNTIEVLRA